MMNVIPRGSYIASGSCSYTYERKTYLAAHFTSE